jgi:hypothetical protein
MLRVAKIPAEQDRRFRLALLEASKAGGPHAYWHIRNSLANGPSRGGIKETLAYFGKADAAFLAPTAPIVDAIELKVPGFKKWLEATGFANDKTMCKGFLKWAEHISSDSKTPGTSLRTVLRGLSTDA